MLIHDDFRVVKLQNPHARRVQLVVVGRSPGPEIFLFRAYTGNQKSKKEAGRGAQCSVSRIQTETDQPI
eukprot:scaffold7506_cov286-Pinguiococcus_pyrenoidosus.AAC.13